MTGVPRGATLLQMRAHDGYLTILLDTRAGSVPVEFELQPEMMHALRHIHALHGHTDGCASNVEVHVDLLRRCLGSLGVLPIAVVVRAGNPPGFFLRLLRPCAGEVHLDLNVLDAVCLLLSRRLPVQLEWDETRDWDAALRRLTDQGDLVNGEKEASDPTSGHQAPGTSS